MFINKLNFAAKNFEGTFSQVNKLKVTVDADQTNQLIELDKEIRGMKEENEWIKHRIDGIEGNLPTMIRELIDYYAKNTFEPKFKDFVTKNDFKEKMINKLDHAIFNDYVNQTMQKDAKNDKEFKTDERLSTIETKLQNTCSKDDMKK